MERCVRALWWKSTQLHPRRWFSGVDLYHVKWKKMTLPDSIGGLLGAVPKGDGASWDGVQAPEFHPSSQVHCCRAQLAANLFAVPHFFDLLAPWGLKLGSGRTQKPHLDGAAGSAPAPTCATWWAATGHHAAVPKLLRTQNLGSHPSCMEIAVKAFFSPMLASFSHAGSPTQWVLQDPAVVWVAGKPLGLFWGRCLQAGNAAGSWPNSSGGRGDTI